MFFSLDGVDGAGKSTQLELLSGWLCDQGYDVVTCRDPGSTSLGEVLRGIVLDRSHLLIHRRSEMLLYMAARAQLVEEVIRPALAEGKVVLSDRFLLANVVYQGYAGGLDVHDVWQVGQVATGGLLPDCVIVLDMDISQAAQRIARALDRIESQGPEYLARVREGFLQEAARHSNVVVVNAAREVAEVQAEIRQALLPHLHRGGPTASETQ